MHKPGDHTVESVGMNSNVMAPQVKICGLTRKDEAVACAALGADAIGFVFYAKSPRVVTLEQARHISAELPAKIFRIGVFVDESVEDIMKTAQSAGLHGVQLHGREPPQTVEALKDEGLMVLKALFVSREPYYFEAYNYPEVAFLVESGVGPLPGGNARAWDFSRLQGFAKRYPLILAGGLSIHNIIEAIKQSQPSAVDISSSVELSSGRKDLNRVKSIIQVVQRMRTTQSKRRIFNADS